MTNKHYIIGIIILLLGFGYFIFGQSKPSISASANNLPALVDGVQILKMDASSTGYTPGTLKIKAGLPVRWEVTNKGVSGCTNAILAPQLFKGPFNINNPGLNTKEFAAPTAGIYRVACWMGMISGTIEVVN